MKTVLTALIFVCGFCFPSYWMFVPGFRVSILHFFHQLNEHPPLWIFGLILLALLIDTYSLQRKAPRKVR